MYEARSQPLSQLLPEEELAAQEALAEKIAKQLIVDERTGELADLAKALKIEK